jgi:CHAT domain-containing protein
VIGLSWAFFIAGCPSTVVSQWKVADISTAQLMAAFYRNLKAGKGKAEALRQAQLSFLLPNPKSKTANQKWNHPFYWSPFILVGDWR